MSDRYLNTLACCIHELAREKGFWDGWYREPGELHLVVKLALVHAEVSEALEELRRHGWRWPKFSEELADILIRTLDIANAIGMDVDREIERKHEANKNRPPLHGKLF